MSFPATDRDVAAKISMPMIVSAADF